MANVAVTAGSVQPGSGVTLKNGTAGATITAGQWLYSDSTDSNDLKLAVSDVIGNVATAAIVGVAMNSASDGQPLHYQDTGSYTVGGTVVLGQTYVLSETAGAMAPFVDISAADVISQACMATSTTVATISIVNSGAVKAA